MGVSERWIIYAKGATGEFTRPIASFDTREEAEEKAARAVGKREVRPATARGAVDRGEAFEAEFQQILMAAYKRHGEPDFARFAAAFCAGWNAHREHRDHPRRPQRPHTAPHDERADLLAKRAEAEVERLREALTTIKAFHVGAWPDHEDQKSIFKVAQRALDEERQDG